MTFYNETLLKLTDNNPQLYRHIWCKWKQINPDTEVAFMMDTTCVHIRYPRHVDMNGVNAEGLKAYLWRLLGRWFKKKDWRMRGTVPYMDTSPPFILLYETFHHSLGLLGYTELHLTYDGCADRLFVGRESTNYERVLAAAGKEKEEMEVYYKTEDDELREETGTGVHQETIQQKMETET
jgi:hypothetical protein